MIEIIVSLATIVACVLMVWLYVLNVRLQADINRSLNTLERMVDDIEVKALALREAMALMAYGAHDEANQVICERVLDFHGGSYD